MGVASVKSSFEDSSQKKGFLIMDLQLKSLSFAETEQQIHDGFARSSLVKSCWVIDLITLSTSVGRETLMVSNQWLDNLPFNDGQYPSRLSSYQSVAAGKT